MRFATLSIVCSLTTAALAQVSGPVMGLVPDRGTIRAMRGIPAAGNVDLPMDAGSALSLIEASNQNFALATSDAGQVLLISLSTDGASVSSAPVTGATANPDKIFMSPNATAAALFYAADQHVEVLAGLPQAPAIRKIDLSTLAAGTLTALAVSDDGQALAVAGTSSVTYLGTSRIALPVAGSPQAFAFFHGSKDVAVITDLEVVTFADPAGAATRTPVWSKPSGSGPNAQSTVGFALSPDNSHLTITGNLGGVESFDLSNNSATYVDCGCTPTALAHLGGSVYRLTGVESGSVKLYDASASEILFVPAAAVRVHRPVIRGAETTGEETK